MPGPVVSFLTCLPEQLSEHIGKTVKILGRQIFLRIVPCYFLVLLLLFEILRFGIDEQFLHLCNSLVVLLDGRLVFLQGLIEFRLCDSNLLFSFSLCGYSFFLGVYDALLFVAFCRFKIFDCVEVFLQNFRVILLIKPPV